MKVSVREVARKLSLSPATVSRVIKGDYGKGALSIATATRVLDYCFGKGFISKSERDSVLYKMKSQTSRKNVFCLTCFEGLWGHNAIYSSAVSAFQDCGEYTSLFTVRNKSDLGRFPFDQASVVVVFGRMRPETQSVLLKNDTPVILVDNHVSNSKWSSVNSDNLDATAKAVDFLVSQGHERIAFVCRHEDEPQKTYNLHQRQSGYIVGMSNHGLDYQDLMITSNSLANNYSPDSSESVMEDLLGLAERVLSLDPLPTAVVAANDLTGHVIRSLAIKKGLRVPQDLSIIGHDAQHRIPGAVHFEPISSMAVNWQAIGKSVVNLYMEIVSSEGQIQKRVLVPSSIDDVGTVSVPREDLIGT
jgi:LacI family transcriptional regulator